MEHGSARDEEDHAGSPLQEGVQDVQGKPAAQRLDKSPLESMPSARRAYWELTFFKSAYLVHEELHITSHHEDEY